MKIEKGKLYYDRQINTVIKATASGIRSGDFTDKIAVHCLTKADCRFVNNVLGHSVMYRDDVVIFIDNLKWSNYDVRHIKEKNYHIITIEQFKEFYPIEEEQEPYSWVNNAMDKVKEFTTKNGSFESCSKLKEVFNPQPHYDNSKGSLYKVATERGWNAYLFDLVKRLERGDKKDPLRQEIEKSIDVLKIWLNEIK